MDMISQEEFANLDGKSLINEHVKIILKMVNSRGQIRDIVQCYHSYDALIDQIKAATPVANWVRRTSEGLNKDGTNGEPGTLNLVKLPGEFNYFIMLPTNAQNTNELNLPIVPYINKYVGIHIATIPLGNTRGSRNAGDIHGQSAELVFKIIPYAVWKRSTRTNVRQDAQPQKILGDVFYNKWMLYLQQYHMDFPCRMSEKLIDAFTSENTKNVVKNVIPKKLYPYMRQLCAEYITDFPLPLMIYRLFANRVPIVRSRAAHFVSKAYITNRIYVTNPTKVDDMKMEIQQLRNEMDNVANILENLDGDPAYATIFREISGKSDLIRDLRQQQIALNDRIHILGQNNRMASTVIREFMGKVAGIIINHADQLYARGDIVGAWNIVTIPCTFATAFMYRYNNLLMQSTGKYRERMRELGKKFVELLSEELTPGDMLQLINTPTLDTYFTEYYSKWNAARRLHHDPDNTYLANYVVMNEPYNIISYLKQNGICQTMDIHMATFVATMNIHDTSHNYVPILSEADTLQETEKWELYALLYSGYYTPATQEKLFKRVMSTTPISPWAVETFTGIRECNRYAVYRGIIFTFWDKLERNNLMPLIGILTSEHQETMDYAKLWILQGIGMGDITVRDNMDDIIWTDEELRTLVRFAITNPVDYKDTVTEDSPEESRADAHVKLSERIKRLSVVDAHGAIIINYILNKYNTQVKVDDVMIRDAIYNNKPLILNILLRHYTDTTTVRKYFDYLVRFAYNPIYMITLLYMCRGAFGLRLLGLTGDNVDYRTALRKRIQREFNDYVAKSEYVLLTPKFIEYIWGLYESAIAATSPTPDTSEPDTQIPYNPAELDVIRTPDTTDIVEFTAASPAGEVTDILLDEPTTPIRDMSNNMTMDIPGTPVREPSDNMDNVRRQLRFDADALSAQLNSAQAALNAITGDTDAPLRTIEEDEAEEDDNLLDDSDEDSQEIQSGGGVSIYYPSIGQRIKSGFLEFLYPEEVSIMVDDMSDDEEV